MRTRIGVSLRLLVIATAAAVAMPLTLMAPAQASPTSDTAEFQFGLGARDRDLDQAVDALEPYVHRSAADGTFVLDAPSRVVELIDVATYTRINDGMNLVNGMITSGLMVPAEGGLAVPAGQGAASDSGEVGILHHGKNEITCSWVNCTLRLDAFWTSKLINALAGGAAAAGIAAVLAAAGVITSPGAMPAGLAAGILALGASVIGFCSNSHGVWIRWGLGSWCGGQ